MSWDYRLADKALRRLKKFPKTDQKRVFEALEKMKSSPFHGDCKLMRGEDNLWRRRVGAYRIYFRPLIEQKMFDVPEIERKQSH